MLRRATRLGSTPARALQQRSITTSNVRPVEMVKLEVNGRPVEIEKGAALIQACEKAGATIPRFCYHDRLAIAGNCRMCLVEVKPGPPKPQASCALPAMEGQKVFTDTPTVHKAREGVMEFLLANHPLDCPICDQGGECDLQDQSVRYGSDRTRFHEYTGKRAVEDKDIGPIVKTTMTRCIQCTRCVRFANEVAGVQDLGTTGRGNDMQIGTYVEKTMNSEMSGNIIDLCPVGALTSKPYAFTARPWELKYTESVDVLDAVGSNIRIDSRGTQVMRVQPRLNDDVNEEWINDKTRYAYDGLRYQRLTTPLIRQGKRFVPATWPEALEAIANGLSKSGATGHEIKAIAGDLADTESLVALKDLVNRLGSDNTALDQPLGDSSPSHGIDVRSNYLFNSTIGEIENADSILLVGTNPRHEAAIINTRLRRSFLDKGQNLGLIGQDFESTFEYTKLGDDLKAVQDLVSGKAKGEFAQQFYNAKQPAIIVGSAVTEHAQGQEIYQALAKYVESKKDVFVTPEWNGFNVLQRAASRAAAYDVGFVPSANASATKPKFVYLLNADEVDAKSLPKDAFVVYQGHHGDVGAEFADVCLPGVAYTEKSATWVNTEGRSQLGRTAVSAPGASREDWKIIRALSEIMGQKLPYDDVNELRDRIWQIAPSVVMYDSVEQTSNPLLGLQQLAKQSSTASKSKSTTSSSSSASPSSIPARQGPLLKPITNFYRTDPISRASVTMAQTTAMAEGRWFEVKKEEPQASGY